MNTAFTTAPTAFAPTYDLFSFVPQAPERPAPPPTGSFVDGLVAALTASFALDAQERELATLLLFGRNIGAAARGLGIDSREAQRRCQALLIRTGTDGRVQLFELALRLAAMTELGKHLLTRGR